MIYLEVIVWLFIRLLVYWFVEISRWKWKVRRSTWKENTVSVQNRDLLSVVHEVSNFCLWMVLMWRCRINRYTKQKATESGTNTKCRSIKRKKKRRLRKLASHSRQQNFTKITAAERLPYPGRANMSYNDILNKMWNNNQSVDFIKMYQPQNKSLPCYQSPQLNATTKIKYFRLVSAMVTQWFVHYFLSGSPGRKKERPLISHPSN